MKKLLSLLLAFIPFLLFGETNSKSRYDYIDLGLPSGTLWAKSNLEAYAFYAPGSYLDRNHVEKEVGRENLPTEENVIELIGNCKFTRSKSGGRPGYKVTGPNGKSIFFPFSGFRNGGHLTDYENELGVFWLNGKPNADATNKAFLLDEEEVKIINLKGERCISVRTVKRK